MINPLAATPPTPVIVSEEPADQPEVRRILRLSDDFTLSLYPPDSCHLLDLRELEAPGVHVYVARAPREAIGMAALVDRADGTGELKRMFVDERARGIGAARALLAEIDAACIRLGIHTLQLETGPLQPAAIALYRSVGFDVIPNFGAYAGDDFSICMEKRLA